MREKRDHRNSRCDNKNWSRDSSDVRKRLLLISSRREWEIHEYNDWFVEANIRNVRIPRSLRAAAEDAVRLDLEEFRAIVGTVS